MPQPSIAAVIVTHNRIELLKGCLAAVRGQTRVPQEIIVVDNGCTDGTTEWLATQTGLTVIRQENQGGSGGQFTGLKMACEAGHDWTWSMDDDTEPTPTALERLTAAPPFADPGTGFLGSLVTWTDGTPHLMNLPYPIDQFGWYHTVLRDHCVSIEYCSFVSLLVRCAAIEQVGLPIREMFIWSDDVEFTQRIQRCYRGYLVLDSIVLHRTKANVGVPAGQVPQSDLPRYCYGVRNRLYTDRKSQLPPVKRIARMGNFLMGQAKMVACGDLPPRVLLWGLRGLVFSPKIQFPAPRHRHS